MWQCLLLTFLTARAIWSSSSLATKSTGHYIWPSDHDATWFIKCTYWSVKSQLSTIVLLIRSSPYSVLTWYKLLCHITPKPPLHVMFLWFNTCVHLLWKTVKFVSDYVRPKYHLIWHNVSQVIICTLQDTQRRHNEIQVDEWCDMRFRRELNNEHQHVY